MYIEFVSDWGPYKAGDIPAENLSDGVCRALIDDKQAKEIDVGTFVRRSIEAETKKIEAKLAPATPGGGTTTAVDRNPGTRPAPPTGGLDFTRIDNGDKIDPAKLTRHERNYHTGEMVRACIAAQTPNAPAEDREWGQAVLRGLYCNAKEVQYRQAGQPGDDEKNVQRFNPNLGITRTGTESVSGGSSYGFLVKPEWNESLFRLPIEESVIEPYAFEIPVGQALEFKQPALDQYNLPTSGQGAAYAGFLINRKGEITQRQYSDAKTDEIDIKITDLTAFTTYSRDLDADAFIRIGAMIQQCLGQGFQWKKDYEFINGNGVGMPLGILNNITVSGAPITSLPPSVLYVTRHASNTITFDDLQAMLQKMHQAYLREAYWITNGAQTLTQLTALENNAGTYAFQPNAMLNQAMAPSVIETASPYDMLKYRVEGKLLGKPLLYSEKLPQLGSTGDLILCNPRYAYGVATRMGIEMGISEHFLFDTDRVAIRWKLRNDAKPLLRGPYIQSDAGITSGNSKVSWAVVLH